MSENCDLSSASPTVMRESVANSDENVDENIGLSPATITGTLSEYCELLKESKRSNSAVPYRQITQFVCRTMSEQNPMLILLQATRLYIDLLSYVSLAYDDITFSTCMHRISKIQKDAATTNCPTHKSNKLMLCTSDDHLSVKEYVSFWRHMVNQLESSHFHTQNEALTPHLVRALGNLLRYAKISDLLEQVVSVVSKLVSQRDGLSSTLSAVYSMAYPALLDNMPSANRNILVQVLICAAEAESEVSMHDSSTVSEPGRNPDRANGENSSVEDNIDSRENENASQVSSHDHSPLPLMPKQSSCSCRALINLFKLCILRVPDKADTRTAMTSTMLKVLSSLGLSSRQGFSDVLMKCAVHSRVPTRLVSTDMASQLALDDELPQLRNPLISLLAIRCSDRIASVRSKAISYLLNVTTELSNANSPSLTAQTVDNYVSKVKDRLQDEKSTVRKAAVDFIGFSCTFFLRHQLDYDKQELTHSPSHLAAMLTYRCTDVVASVRLAAANQIFQIIQENSISRRPCITEATLMSCIESILPLIDDVDNRCREACLQLVHGVMLMDLGQPNPSSIVEPEDDIHINTTKMFSHLLASQKQINVRLAERAISDITREGRLSDKDIELICKPVTNGSTEEESDISCQEKQGVWVAAAAMASAGKARVIWRIFGMDAIMRAIRSGHNGSACKVAYAHVENMNEDEKKRLQADLLEVMFRRDDIGWSDGRGIQAVSQVIGRLQGDMSGNKFLIRCESMIRGFDEMNSAEVIHLLHLIGNICDHMKVEKAPPEKLLRFVQVMTSDEQSEARVRALALVTLGKVCLCETKPATNNSQSTVAKIGENLTRRFVSVFVHELDNAVSSATRGNAVVILCDLCRQYTAIVEPFMTRIAGLLSDKSVFVRNQVLCSLMCLLQEDYIKIRPGFLLFQVIKRLLDECEEVRKTAEYSLIHVVTQKKQSVLAVCFVDVIMVLNECTQSETVVQFESAFQTDVITTGKDNTVKRNKIYNILLSGMSAEQRWQIPSRLRKDIICNIVEEKMLLEEKGVASVLEDALNIFSWDTVNFLNKRRVGESNAAFESATTAVNATEDVDNQASKMSDLSRFAHVLGLREHTMPLLIELRQFLQIKRSPILGTLNKCICELLQPHKQQLDLFIPDATIRSQIEHEMNQQSSK